MDDSYALSPLIASPPTSLSVAAPSSASPPRRTNSDGTSSDKPDSIDLSHHLSDLAKARLTSPLKGLYKYFNRPGMLMFAGGLPPPAYFPFETISTTTLARNAYRASAPSLGSWLLSLLPGGGAKKTDSWEIRKFEDEVGKVQLSSALQYGTAAGLPALHSFIDTFTAHVYRPATSDWATVINAGSTDAWGKIVTTLCNPGDGVLAEEWTYPSALASAWPYGIRPVALPMDGEGMTPEGMDDLLGNWNEEERGGMKRPRVLYTIPVTQNPTGATMTLERKKAIYKLAVKYDVIIVEDDPYYFLQTPEYEPSPTARAASQPSATESDDDFLKSLVPSYLALDYEGRVVRIDTFSKTICPGSRLGWTTCNPLFAERLERANESSTQSASGFAQALVGKLLAEEWGLAGYLRWLKGIKAEYTARRDALVDRLLHTSDAKLDTRERLALSPAWASKHAKVFEMYMQDAVERDEKSFLVESVGKEGEERKVLSFVAPQGGMFVWLRVHFASHPHYHRTPTPLLLSKLWENLAESSLLVAPGSMFNARTFGAPSAAAFVEGSTEGGEVFAVTEDGDGFFRLSFSTASEDDMDRAAKIIKKVVGEFFKA
ncbi:hypothetical protein JCM6882_007700 [Rhodosporidiobolus microsporus]